MNPHPVPTMNNDNENDTPAPQAEAKDVDALSRALMEEASLTPFELELCRSAAEGRGLDLAGWVRAVILDEAGRSWRADYKRLCSSQARKRKELRQSFIGIGGSTAPEIMAKLTAWAYFSMADNAVRFQAFPHANTSEKARQYRISVKDCGWKSWKLDRPEKELLTGYKVAETLYNLALMGAKFSGEVGTILHGQDAEKRGYPPPSKGAMDFTPNMAWAAIAEDAGVEENRLLEYLPLATADANLPPLTYPAWTREVLPLKANAKRNG